MNSFLDRIPRYFLLFFAIFFVTIFLAFYESFRGYRAEADLFVLSKSAAISSETATRTIALFPATLGFYERLLSDHEEIEDPWTEESKYERKTSWARVIESSVIPGTNLIRLSISSASAEQSTALLNASLETLYGFSGRLYDRETEADIRLLEDVTVHSTFHSLWALLLLSVTLSGLFAFLVSSLFQKSFGSLSLPKFSLRRAPAFSLASEKTESIRPVGVFHDLAHPETRLETVETKESSSPEEKQSDVLKEMPREEAVTEPRVSISEASRVAPEILRNESAGAGYIEFNIPPAEKRPDEPEDIWEKPRPIPVAPRVSVSSGIVPEGNSVRVGSVITSVHEKKQVMPGNLETVSVKDFTWEKVFSQNELASSESEANVGTSTESLPAAPEKREPTPEELKARLNQLLRGEM